jgi:N-acetylmuramoyl-L-alanine amidase
MHRDRSFVIWVLSCFMFCTLFSNIAFAEIVLKKAELSVSSTGAQVSLYLNEKLNYRLFALHKPERVVLDLENTKNKAVLNNFVLNNTPIEKIRVGHREGGNLRIVFDMKEAILPKLVSSKNSKGETRIHLDFAKSTVIAKAPEKIVEKLVEKPKSKIKPKLKTRPFIVAIDPGHGGVDPGAIGRKGTQEKKIVLEIAKRMKRKIDQEPGLRAILVRDGDYYIPLRKRMEIAREHHADLFVSIHADAFHHANASGASVFVVSKRGASSEAAKWLADIENKADLLGGIGLGGHKDTVLASVLLDLSQTASNAASMEIAKEVLKEIAVVTPLHKDHVEQAGFLVLKAPDIPSILIETGFISHQKSEHLLSNHAHQEELAQAMTRAIKRYFNKKPLLAIQGRNA